MSIAVRSQKEAHLALHGKIFERLMVNVVTEILVSVYTNADSSHVRHRKQYTRKTLLAMLDFTKKIYVPLLCSQESAKNAVLG